MSAGVLEIFQFICVHRFEDQFCSEMMDMIASILGNPISLPFCNDI